MLKRPLALIGYLILCLAVFAAFVMQDLIIDRVNEKDNATRCSVVALVVRLSQNTRRSAEATIASAKSTRDQKLAARANLRSIVRYTKVTRHELGDPTGERCAVPEEPLNEEPSSDHNPTTTTAGVTVTSTTAPALPHTR